MKISVSLSEQDVAVLDQMVASQRAANRSNAVSLAVDLMRKQALQIEYEQAAHEWASSEEAIAWQSTVDDGLSSEHWQADAPR